MSRHYAPDAEVPSEDDRRAILTATLGAPFEVLGPAYRGRKGRLLAFDPHASWMTARTRSRDIPLEPLGDGLFSGWLGRRQRYRLVAGNGERMWDHDDAYRFGPCLGELDLHLIHEGRHYRLWDTLGAHPVVHESVRGTRFAVWAPNARRVSVVGNFNGWDGRRAPMRRRGDVWELFLPGIDAGEVYKYEILPHEGAPFLKADPVALEAEHPPATASRVAPESAHGWQDGGWMEARARANAHDAPISIFEAHLASWRRGADSYQGARALVDYVRDMGFTHLELMPLAEYPFGGSWGYQPTALYAPSSRFGSPDDLRALIDYAHQQGIGVLMDWVPAHFPSDPHGLAGFDGTALYEYADPREGFHPDWNTLIYNWGRLEVRNFLAANALYWLSEFHLDGLRVDAVASMLYRDYSREAGQWVPNHHGGRENLEAIAFLQEMNRLTYGEAPEGVMTVAEESTSWPGVTRAVHDGGLGFGFKWNMGWMNDTLRYMAYDPIHRCHHHDLMTFGLVYAFSENFILPISHDEVVHGKGSLLTKMPGDIEAKFANLRAYLGFMWGHPGKKLLFMGCEFGQWHEWNHDGELDWGALGDPRHAGVQALVRDLNHLYRASPGLWRRDHEAGGFHWLEREARDDSILAWIRFGAWGDPPVVVIANLTPIERRWRCGLPQGGVWREALNTDAGAYGGGNRGNMGHVHAEPHPWHGQEHSTELTLPPLATLFLIPEAS